jgi:TonB-dependent receptor
MAATAVSAGANAEEQKQSYRFPRGDAAAILAQFATESGRPILYMMDQVRGVQTNALTGTFTPREALDRLLAGTALVAVHDPKSGGFIVNRRAAPSQPEHAEAEKARGPPNGHAAPPSAPPKTAQSHHKEPPPVKPTNLFARLNRWFSSATSTAKDSSTIDKKLRTLAGSIAATVSVLAQSPETGSISGRVYNPTTGQYVRNAEIRLLPGNQSTESETGGVYRIGNIPAGPVQLAVKYSGYSAPTVALTISAGTDLTHDFELTPIDSPKPDANSPQIVKLTAFVVSSEKEGNAKAIMSQRSSMNITNSVSADAFGDVPEDQVGEMLKNMPGVDVNRVGENVRNIRLRGLPAEYASVTLDGVAIATVDASSGSAGDSRAMSFEQASLSSLESIEVMKTVSADVDANAPAGTINLKTKRAFDRNGRRIGWQVTAGAFSSDLTLAKKLAPDEHNKRRLLPGASFEYSDIFLNKRLGVVVNLSNSNVFNSPTFTTTTINTAATAADPRPAVVTGLSIQDVMNVYARENATITVDMKITPSLIASLGFTHTFLNIISPRNVVSFATGGRTTVLGNNPVTGFSTSDPAANVSSNAQRVEKYTRTKTYTPKFEYRWKELTLEGTFALSDGRSWYDVNRRGSIASFNNPTLTGVNFEARRSGVTSGEWFVRQISGPDWANGNAFSSPTFNLVDGRFAESELYSGELTAKLKTNRFFPIDWKAGFKTRHETRDFEVFTTGFRYDYTGPGAGLGAWARYQSVYSPDPNYISDGVAMSSVSGRPIFAPSLLQVREEYRANPGFFTKNVTTTNYYDAFVGNQKHYEETIDAAFIMATARFSKLLIRAGVRREETGTDAEEPDVIPPTQVVAAGFPVSGGRATTIPGIDYQYRSRPKEHRTGSYGNVFPSASLKYKLKDNFDLQLGYSKTIRRPAIRDLAGVWSINDSNLTVSAPNPGLQPEISDNFSARAAYYYEPVGTLAVNLFQNNVNGLFQTTRMSAMQYGYTESDLQNYEFITTVSGTGRTVMRGLELEYSQVLSFLPSPFNGFSVRANYGRNYANRVITLAAPHRFSGGLSYSIRGYRLFVNANWNDNTPVDLTKITYLRHRLDLDAGGSIPLPRRTSLFFTIKNPLNVPYVTMSRLTAPASSTSYAVFGTEWNVGIRGTF